MLTCGERNRGWEPSCQASVPDYLGEQLGPAQAGCWVLEPGLQVRSVGCLCSLRSALVHGGQWEIGTLQGWTLTGKDLR